MLTDFDGTQFKYDEIGNPVKIGDSELTWNGRQLTNINGNDLNISYAYNGDGLRISKEVDGVKTEYFYNGSLLAGQKTGDDVIVFMYDNNGDIFGFTYNGTEYYYVKNLQNDVTAITDSNGNIIVNYYYDAWGNPTGTTGDFKLAEINPIRYRSYYFDEETGFYYLNSRYYASTIGRFLNADEYSQTGQGMLDKNVFAYCENNPVNRIDLNGSCWFDVNGVWRHDNWEYFGGYERKPNPLIASKSTSNGNVLFCKPGTSATAPRDTFIVYDKRKKGPKKDNNFEIQNSYLITDKIQKTEICQAIIDYNNEDSGDYGWNREIDTMTVEWDWHNGFHRVHLLTSHTESVNFDMGLGTNSTSYFLQIAGYAIEWAIPYIRVTIEFIERNNAIWYPKIIF